MLIRIVQNAAWHEPIDSQRPVDQENIRGDAAKNFQCQESCLSFFRINNVQECQKVAAAVAARRKGLDDVQYFTIDEAMVATLGAEIRNAVPGETHDEQVNAWHVDVGGLNLSRLAALTRTCVEHGTEGSLRAKQLREVLVKEIQENRLNFNDLSKGLQQALADHINK